MIRPANAQEWNIFAAQVQHVRIQEKGVASPRQNSKIAYSCGATNGKRILGGINIGGSSDKENVDDGGAGLFGSLLKWDSRFSKSPKINEVLESERAGSALKSDPYHAFPDIVDNYAGDSIKFPVKDGTLYQIEGSLNGKPGRFEWIIEDGMVTHRFFVENGIINGRSIRPW